MRGRPGPQDLMAPRRALLRGAVCTPACGQRRRRMLGGAPSTMDFSADQTDRMPTPRLVMDSLRRFKR